MGRLVIEDSGGGDGPRLRLVLSRWEALGACRPSRELAAPLSDVAVAAVSLNPWSDMAGVRAPGTGLPGVVMLGTLRRCRAGLRPEFCAVYGRRPAVVVEFAAGGPWGRWWVTAPADGAGGGGGGDGGGGPQAIAARLGGAAAAAREGRGGGAAGGGPAAPLLPT
jgi:hypothetical protein